MRVTSLLLIAFVAMVAELIADNFDRSRLSRAYHVLFYVALAAACYVTYSQ